MKSHQFIVFVPVFAFVLALTGYGQQTAEQLYQSALYKEEIEGELDSAIKVYQTILKQYPENRPVAAKTQMHIGLCYEELGNAPARKAYENVVRDYANQADIVAELLIRLTTLAGATGGSGSSTLIVRKVLAGAPDSKHLPTEFVKTDGTYDMMLVEVVDGSAKLLKALGKELSPGGCRRYSGKSGALGNGELPAEIKVL